MLSKHDKWRRAAHNNADLCAAIMAANGRRTERNDLAFVCVDPPLPFYPKVVTLTPDASRDLDALIRGHSGIKDSFACLDVTLLNLQVAFEASWIWSDLIAESLPPDWVRIESAPELSTWHHAWTDSGNVSDDLIFPPACLNDPSLVFLARMSGATVTAGCIANLSEDVVGMSNVFETGAVDKPLYSEALAAVSAVGAGRPVVGYEQGRALTAACTAGFAPVGPLRVLV